MGCPGTGLAFVLPMNQPRSLKMRYLALACIVGASTMASAQTGGPQPRWGRPTAPRSGACFYRDPGFGGPYFCARAGENIAFMSRGMNDQISSIKMFGLTEVTIFQDVRYAGRWTRLEGDVFDLRREGWNDRLSSVRVSPGDWRDLAEYGGRYGDRYSDGYGDRQNGSGLGRIESSPWRDDRYDERDGSGPGRYYPNDDRSGSGADRYPTDRRDGSGSFQYDPQYRGNADPRGGVGSSGRAVETADVIVRRLYQEVLLREVDPEGLTLYRNHMSNDRWSEQDVRNSLLKSPEYLQRTTVAPQLAAEQLVARAYRSVLAREPDPASRVYVDKVMREHWTEADVSRELRNSPEYRSKHQ